MHHTERGLQFRYMTTINLRTLSNLSHLYDQNEIHVFCDISFFQAVLPNHNKWKERERQTHTTTVGGGGNCIIIIIMNISLSYYYNNNIKHNNNNNRSRFTSHNATQSQAPLSIHFLSTTTEKQLFSPSHDFEYCSFEINATTPTQVLFVSYDDDGQTI